jgi:hypothetical protein
MFSSAGFNTYLWSLKRNFSFKLFLILQILISHVRTVHGQLGQDSRDRTVRTGQPGTGEPVQESQDKTSREGVEIVHSGQEREDRRSEHHS